MKTMKNLLFVAFAATTIIGCQKEHLVNETQNEAVSKSLVTFTGVTDDVDTKTMIFYESELGARSFKTRFMEADYIMVNGYKSGKIEKVDEGKSGTEITFTVPFDEGKDDAPYYAVTAAQVASESYYDESTHTYTLSVSGTQGYRLVKSSTNTSYDNDADILAAYSDKLTMSFKHMSTFLAITMDENSELKDNIETVYVRQADGGNIAGKWFLKFDENNEPYLEPSELTSVISYRTGIVENGVEQGKVLIIGVPSYNYEKGLLVTIKDVNGKFVSYKINDANYAEKGGVIIPFKPKFNPGSGVIKTAQDWNDFAAAVNSSKDADLYRWVGNGTVKLGANIEAENLATITRTFPYVFDGCGYYIKRTAATRQLFSEVSGEIKNLTLKGEVTLEGDGAPFVKNLCAGAKLTNCTNEMNVKFNITSGPFYIGGIAAIMIKQDSGEETSTELTGCVNKGSIIGTGDFTAANGTVAIGGIIGDIRSAGGDVPYDVTFKDCSNEGEIKFAPKPPANNTTTGMKLCGIGGIVGYIRSGQVLEFENCDNTNTGNITLSAEYMTNEKGMKAYAISMGGIIGFGTANSASGYQTTEGFDISLVDCDNSGVLHNCGDNYSTSSETVNKVYTGGLAGSLMGLSSESKAIVKNCTNTGKIFTYDLVTGDQTVISARPAYNAVAGGLVGFGGNLDIQDCTITAQIGNGKRPMVAWGGVIGYVVAPFRVCNLNLELNGYYQRLSTYKFSRSVIANVPVKGITADITGSIVEGTINVSKYVLSGTELSGDDKSDLSASLKTKIFNSESKVESNLVYGQGYTANAGVDFSSATINYSEN